MTIGFNKKKLLGHFRIDLEKSRWSFSGDTALLTPASEFSGFESGCLDDLLALVWPDDYGRTRAFLTSAMTEGTAEKTCKMDLRLKLPDSNYYLPCILEGYFTCRSHGKKTRFFGSLCSVDPMDGLDQILNFSADMLALLDAECRFLKLNNAYAGMFKKTPQDLIGKTISEAFSHDPGHYHSIIEPILQDCLQNRPTHFRQWVSVPEFGDMFLDISYSPVLGEEGEVQAIAIVCRDNTEIMHSLEALKESENILNRAEKIAKLGGWSYNVASQEMLWTDEMYEIHGVDKSFVPTNEILKKQFSKEDWEILANNLNLNLLGKQTDTTAALTTPDGTRKWVRSLAFPIIGDDGKILEIQGVLQDVTVSITYEKELETQKIMYETLAETSNDVIARYDINGRHTYINSAVEAYSGITQEQFIGKTNREAGSPENVCEFWETMMARTISSGEPTSDVFTFRDPEGNAKIFECQLFPEFSKNGSLEYLVSTSRDITERIKAEEELQKLAKLNSLGLLAGGIAHDFNNILTMMFGNVSLAKSNMNESDPGYLNLERAEEAFARASRLTNQLLTFAKGGSPIKKHIKLKTLIEEVAKFDMSGSNVKLELRIADDLWDTYADQGQLEQVFTNLVINAVQAMPDGGLLQINATNINVPENNFSNLQAGSHVMIEIEDTGEGIPNDRMDHIFDPYYSTKEKGSGLGLATVYSVITKHNGRIQVDSQVGRGTRFSIYLPAGRMATESQEPPSEPQGLPDNSTATRRILVMDDEKMIRDVAASILRKKGYLVDLAENGDQAIGIYKQSLEEGAAFDCIIMDLTIPGGIGGKDAIVEILKLNPEAKVIVSSGYSEDQVMACYSDYGFKGVLPKPFSYKSMNEVVEWVFLAD